MLDILGGKITMINTHSPAMPADDLQEYTFRCYNAENSFVDLRAVHPNSYSAKSHARQLSQRYPKVFTWHTTHPENVKGYIKGALIAWTTDIKELSIN